MSRVNRFIEGHIARDSYPAPAKKRKNNPRGFRLPKKLTRVKEKT